MHSSQLAHLFGSAVLPQHEEVVRMQLRRECELIEHAPFQPGETIGGRYQVQKIMRGGFGLVYLCQQLGSERFARGHSLVALKTPLPRHLATPKLRELFTTEATHCVTLGAHPNLVLAYGVEEYNRLPYLVLEYIPGARSLADEILAGKTDWRTTLRVGLGVAQGLAFAGLVHGDLKPNNILLSPDGTAKVADFGLALTPDEAADETSLAGTLGFFAPEMLVGQSARNLATDLYAYGVMLFISATGCFPFPLAEADRCLVEPAPSPRSFVAGMPAEFAELILRCLDRDPVRRPGNFNVIATELKNLHRLLLGAEPLAESLPDAPAKADALVNAAQSWTNLGRLTQAKAAVYQALALKPDNWKAHCALGMALLAANDFSGALASFSAAHEFSTDALEPMVNAAQAANTLGRKEDARRWLLLAINHCGIANHFAPLDSCSQLAIELLVEKDADRLIHQILAENPQAAMTWNNRAVLMRRRGAPVEALASAERALAINPTYAKAYVQKANALLELGRIDEAIVSADRALVGDTTLVGAYAAKFSALASSGRFEEARTCVLRGLAVLPENELLLRALRKLP
jgi:serine/threonine-protein kinase